MEDMCIIAVFLIQIQKAWCAVKAQSAIKVNELELWKMRFRLKD